MSLSPITDSHKEVAEFIGRLYEATQISGFGKCKKSIHTVHNTQQAIESWKFNEWEYSKPRPLTSAARGLFTVNDERIAVRGYDKFFNVNEVDVTRRETLSKDTKGPYEVTLKENGCIIFLSGLADGEIVVCSKHSTGVRDGTYKNHALEGEARLITQLLALNKTTHDLGRYLYQYNLTAVAELCDDEFEEHVLPYSKEQSGLYLHGLNYNTIKFKTVAMDKVEDFATTWGFKSVEYFLHDSFDSLFTMLDKAAESGCYNGREVEGFVIRCKNTSDEDFFFKYKFEEPYLLYRQLRELTKKFLNGTPIEDLKVKKNRFISRKYLKFIEPLFAANSNLAEDYANGHGIVKVRKLFLEELHETSGIRLLTLDNELSLQKDNIEEFKNLSISKQQKYVLVPIATIGCGKTTVFQTLQKLFPSWGHIQNDNIGRGSIMKIAEHCLSSLQDADVVMFDRNNSEFRERKQVFENFETHKSTYLDQSVNFNFIGINFVSNSNSDTLWDVTYNRLKARGDNHQSIKFQTDERAAVGIMKGFISRFQPVDSKKLPDCQFDLVIDLDVNKLENSSLANVKTIITQLIKSFPDILKEEPSEEQYQSAFKLALSYQPSFTKKMGKLAKKSPSYFGISVVPETFIPDLDATFGDNEQWLKLKSSNRVHTLFHVTLGHFLSTKADKSLKPKWKNMVKRFDTEIVANSKTQFLDFYADIKITRIVIKHEFLICASVEILQVFDADFKPVEAVECLNQHLHITIGTFEPQIKPSQSNIVLNKLHDSQITSLGSHNVEGIDVSIICPETSPIYEKQRLFAQY